MISHLAMYRYDNLFQRRAFGFFSLQLDRNIFSQLSTVTFCIGSIDWYHHSMTRGSGNEIVPAGILYGSIGPRWSPPAGDFQRQIADNVIGYFKGGTGLLFRAEISDAENNLFIGEEYFDGPATIYIEDQRQDLDPSKLLDSTDDLRLHRDRGPAVEYKSGDQEWWQRGQLHRDDGPAVTRRNGNESWFKNGQLHRDDGPAEIFRDIDGVTIYQWSQYGLKHRDDGPAVIEDYGPRRGSIEEYWLYGEEYLAKASWEQAVIDSP